MAAPEKIYVHEASAPELTEELPYCIEYVRADAFIEKAVGFLRVTLNDRVEIIKSGTIIPSLIGKQELIMEFKNYLKEK